MQGKPRCCNSLVQLPLFLCRTILTSGVRLARLRRSAALGEATARQNSRSFQPAATRQATVKVRTQTAMLRRAAVAVICTHPKRAIRTHLHPVRTVNHHSRIPHTLTPSHHHPVRTRFLLTRIHRHLIHTHHHQALQPTHMALLSTSLSSSNSPLLLPHHHLPANHFMTTAVKTAMCCSVLH